MTGFMLLHSLSHSPSRSVSQSVSQSVSHVSQSLTQPVGQSDGKTSENTSSQQGPTRHLAGAVAQGHHLGQLLCNAFPAPAESKVHQSQAHSGCWNPKSATGASCLPSQTLEATHLHLAGHAKTCSSYGWSVCWSLIEIQLDHVGSIFYI